MEGADVSGFPLYAHLISPGERPASLLSFLSSHDAISSGGNIH